MGLEEARIPLLFSDVGIFQTGQSLAKAEDLVKAIPTFPKEEAYCFEENMVVMTNILVSKIQEKGSEVLNGVTVERIERIKDGFRIYFKEIDKEKTTEVEQVVFATPLVITQKIFPDLKIKTNIYYTSCIDPPKARVPDLKTEIKGVYLCGDFYSYAGHTENAVASAEIVAEEISKEI